MSDKLILSPAERLDLLAVLAAPLVGRVLEAHRRANEHDPSPAVIAEDIAIAADYMLHALRERCTPAED